MQKLFPLFFPVFHDAACNLSSTKKGNDLPGEIDITVDWFWGMLTLDGYAPFAQAQEADQSRRLR